MKTHNSKNMAESATCMIFKSRVQTIILLLLVINHYVAGQNIRKEYGKVTGEDMIYKECPFDKSAEAVVLFDKAQTYFSRSENGFDVIFDRVTRIKILKDGGTEWAKVEIPLYTSNNIYEKVDDLSAVAYNFENNEIKTTELNREDCHIEKLSDNWVVQKFAVPNVKAGTVIEYKYRITSEYLFNLRDWNFQWKIPVLDSEYIVHIIPFYEYTYLLQGANQFSTQTSVESTDESQFGSIKYKDMIYTYGMKNVPAFKDEEYITSLDDYIIKLDFQLSKIHYPNGSKKEILTSWPQLKEDLMQDENFGGFIEKCKKSGEKLFDNAGMVHLTNQQKFDSIINYVKRNFTWNKSYRIYNSKKINKLQADKFGNSADLNLLAIGLLNKVGITARPILISTRNHGKIKTSYPFFDGFNSVIIGAQIDSTLVIADATDILLNNNTLPIQCLNDKGLIIDKTQRVEWVNLMAGKPSTIKTSINATITEEAITSRFEINADNYLGLNLSHDYGVDKTKLLKYISNQNYEISDSSLVIKNIAKASDSYSYKFAAIIKPEKLKTKIYVSPFFNEVIGVNPLKQKERNYPIDMVYTNHKIYESDFIIPNGYKVTFIPTDMNVDNKKYALSYKIVSSGNHIHATLSYIFNHSEYPASDYFLLKSFFEDIITKSGEKIVLEKL